MSEVRDLAALPTLEGGVRRQNAGRAALKADGQAQARTYDDVPMLKPSLWSWEISSYFFFGGLSGGAFLLARMADRFGGDSRRDVARTGTAISLAALAPCAPLLIADLGDPTRFHYMLRVFKPKSPMNLGAWVLTAFSAVLSLTALNEWRKARRRGKPGGLARFADAAIDAVSDGAGVPLALTLAGYTGVLLSTTATPVWTRNRWLGPLFSASAVGTGAAAIDLVLATGEGRESRRRERAMRRISLAARVAEAATLGGFLAAGGSAAAPITRGKYAPHLWGGAIGAGLLLSSVLEAIPAPAGSARKWLRVAGAASVLAGGLALRWAITQAGRPSGSDPGAARRSEKPGR
jgi:formate-dependent nitrite reductase membrane component NrfD